MQKHTTHQSLYELVELKKVKHGKRHLNKVCDQDIVAFYLEIVNVCCFLIGGFKEFFFLNLNLNLQEILWGIFLVWCF